VGKGGGSTKVGKEGGTVGDTEVPHFYGDSRLTRRNGGGGRGEGGFAEGRGGEVLLREDGALGTEKERQECSRYEIALRRLEWQKLELRKIEGKRGGSRAEEKESRKTKKK